MVSCKDCEYFFITNYFSFGEGNLLVCCCEQFEKINGEGYLENLQTCNMFKEVE